MVGLYFNGQLTNYVYFVNKQVSNWFVGKYIVNNQTQIPHVTSKTSFFYILTFDVIFLRQNYVDVL